MSETTNLYGNGFTQRLFVEPDYSGSLERGGKRRCMGCMHLYDAEFDMCPYCGYAVNTEIEYAALLQPGTVLNQKYIVGKAIGYSDFGVVYLAWDTEYRRKVTIKEYLPKDLSTRGMGQPQITVFPGEKGFFYENGLEVFVENAVHIAKYRRESAVVTVFDVFEENKTAYIVREYLEGETLEERLEKEEKFSLGSAMEILAPIIGALHLLHTDGIIHMNIEPCNIFLSDKGEVKLIDFGMSKFETAFAGRNMNSMISEVYSPEEVYRSLGDFGSWTDVYSVAAILYRMLTGKIPADSFARRRAFEKNGKDILEPIEKLAPELTVNQARAIKNAMNVFSQDRTPDMATFMGELYSEDKVRPRKNRIKKVDRLKWPLWAKIAAPTAAALVLTFGVLVFSGVIGPKSTLEKSYSIPAGKTAVPNIHSKDITQAEKILKEHNLQFVIADAQSNNHAVKDTVIRQEPDVGEFVNYGEVIRLTVSSGPGMAYVEDVTGFAIEDARELLEGRGFKVVTRNDHNSDYAKDVVYDQTIKNIDQEKGTEITLYVSSGSSAIVTSTEILIPDLVGTDYDNARRSLKSAGLYLAIVDIHYDENLPEGQIVDQVPKGDEKGRAGEIITVTVNKQSNMVYVPDTEGMKKEAAVEDLEALGLVVELKEAEDRRTEKGTVITQSIGSGSSVSVGTRITLTVSTGYTAEVPDVCGKPLEEAQKILMESGFSSRIKDYGDSSEKKDTVLLQSVDPGTKAELGTEVMFIVSNESIK
ncbi:MAG: PASTA domain-containing protein [Clostridia bacterium]|nr:PASTA domain-containing protein [Clostridia bacterium]